MAVTKFHSITVTEVKALEYITNPEKRRTKHSSAHMRVPEI